MTIKLTHAPGHDWAEWTAAVIVGVVGGERVEMFACAQTPEMALLLLSRQPGFAAMAEAA